MTSVIDLVPHLDAGDRKRWQGDQNERPLTELGRRQGLALADALGAEPIDALYSSPALRCRQTLEPLAARLGLQIATEQGLGAEVWSEPHGWSGDGYAAAHAAGGGLRAIEAIAARHDGGRVVACSHGQIIPALAAFEIGLRGLSGVRQLTRRGQWYRLRLGDGDLAIELLEAPAGFPS